MKRFTLVFAAMLLAPFLFSPVRTQVNGNLAGAISQLLDYPAPPPPPPKDLAEVLAAMEDAAIKTGAGDPPDPGDDAPIKVLIDYWGRAGGEVGKQPSEKVRQRLLQACEEGPEFPPYLLGFLPNTPDAHARIKRILDEEQNASAGALDPSQQYFRQGLREWLMCNSEYLRDELISGAISASDDSLELSFEMKGPDQLTALARLDWKTAEPLLKDYAEGAAPLTAVVALRLLYEHAAQNNQSAEVDSYRDRLKRIAGDPKALDAFGRSPFMAAYTLMETDWQGRDEWFLSLFADPRFSEMKGGYLSTITINALAMPVSRDPDRWIPAISQLIGHTDRNVHNAAALCLARNQARKDALLPLLPWLSDPQWVDGSNEYERGQLAGSVGLLNVREALPGLIRMIRNENEKGPDRSQAIRALAKMRDSSVIPVLRGMIQAGMKDPKDPIVYSQYELTQALIACGGLTIDETVAALESCAAKADVKVENRRGDRHLDISSPYPSIPSPSEWFDIEVAWIVVGQEYASEALAAAVVERLKSLRKEKPDVAAKLWLIAQQWRFPAVDVAIVERIADGSANLDMLLTAYERRQDLRANAGGALRELVAAGGYQAGVGAALLGDQSSELDILKGSDRAARVALLACARMLREPLPVDKTGALLKSPDKLLALAAERYLESEDSAEARNLILGLHQGEALILGARTRFDPKPGDWGDWIRWEDPLRKDVKKNRADEIFATLEDYHSDSLSRGRHSAIVRVVRGKAELCKQKDAMREECRQLTESELQALRELYEEVSFDDSGPIILPGDVSSGSSREFIKLDKSGGRRVYTSELNHLKEYLPNAAKKPHVKLESFFELLCGAGEFEPRYALKARIEDLEVIVADDQHPVSYVCKQGDEIRALVREKDAGQTETNGETKWEDAVWRWHSVVNNQLGEIADQPDACPILDAGEDMPEEMRKYWQEMRRYRTDVENSLWEIRSGRYFVRAGWWKDQVGLWLCSPGAEPKLIVEDMYSTPLMTPDGNHLVAVTRNPRFATLVRIEIRNKQVTKVETDHFYDPLTLVPGSGNVYFQGNHGEQTEHMLLDPASGKLEAVKGDLDPLGHQKFRPLQPVAGSQEYWAAIPDSEKNLTRVGRYDARAFSFKPLMEIPEILFTSDEMWIDETARRIYLAYKGHLLRLQLASDQKSSGK
jgi:hypothetical protein